jgi:hypothetical protein
MNKIIQSLWIGRPLSVIEQLSITSFLQNGHEYHLYGYRDIKNVPAGATLKDASEILPPSEIFSYRHGASKGSLSAFSNLFRYKLLLQKGGWWSDTDIVCLRPLDFTEPIVFASERNDTGTRTATAVIRLPPGHAVARLCYEAARQEDRSKLPWGKTGPLLLDRIVHEVGLQQFIKAPEVFCPLDFWKWKMLLEKPNPADPLITNQSYTLHLWHELWRRSGLKVNPATGEFQPLNSLHQIWRRLRRKPTLTVEDASSFTELRRRYSANQSAD